MKKFNRQIVAVTLVVVIIATIIITLITSYHTEYEYSEAGYLTKIITESSYHYEFDIDMNYGCPEFVDNYYFTVYIDDQYIKFQVPYQVFEKYHLGDHITVCRRKSLLFNKYKDYNGVLYDINVPAIIVTE